MKKNKVIAVNLPEEWCKKLKRMSLEKSLELDKNISVSLLIKKALKKVYFKEEE